MAARCVAVLGRTSTLETMHLFLERVLPWLAAIDDCTKQEGAIEAMACILHTPPRPGPGPTAEGHHDHTD